MTLEFPITLIECLQFTLDQNLSFKTRALSIRFISELTGSCMVWIIAWNKTSYEKRGISRAPRRCPRKLCFVLVFCCEAAVKLSCASFRFPCLDVKHLHPSDFFDHEVLLFVPCVHWFMQWGSQNQPNRQSISRCRRKGNFAASWAEGRETSCFFLLNSRCRIGCNESGRYLIVDPRKSDKALPIGFSSPRCMWRHFLFSIVVFLIPCPGFLSSVMID